MRLWDCIRLERCRAHAASAPLDESEDAGTCVCLCLYLSLTVCACVCVCVCVSLHLYQCTDAASNCTLLQPPLPPPPVSPLPPLIHPIRQGSHEGWTAASRCRRKQPAHTRTHAHARTHARTRICAPRYRKVFVSFKRNWIMLWGNKRAPS